MRLSRLLPIVALALSPMAARATPPLGAVELAAPVVAEHKGVFGGVRTSYRSVVEPIEVSDPAGKPVARLVATSYIARVADSAKRPVLFVFNGGPIGPSTPLHMGAFGPRRVAVPDDLAADPATFQVVDNVYAPIDVADVVIFDPANTGYSRTLPGVDPASQFSNVADGRQLAQLILAWRRIHARPDAPIYLVGESYGTMRAVEVADQLQQVDQPVAGIFLLGQAVNIIEYAQRPNNIVSYAVSLPTLAAIGWYHGKADRQGRSLEQFVADAKAYGAGEYLSVLFLGDTAPAERVAAVARRLEQFTGLPAAEFVRQRLKVSKTAYQRLLFPGQLLDTNDARYIVPAGQKSAGYLTRFDPAMQEHLRSFLKMPDIGAYAMDNPAGDSFASWDWAPNKTPFLDWPYVGQLKSVMEKNPHLRLFVANGYFDTQTTVGAMDYLVAQSGLPRDRVETASYRGGHMFYTVEDSLRRFSDDVRRVVRAR